MGLRASANQLAHGDTYIMPYSQQTPAWSVADASVGFNFTRLQSSTYLGGGAANQGSTAEADDSDSVSYFVNLAAGTYTVTIMRVSFNNQAIVEVFVDAASLGTVDLYSAGAVVNIITEFTGVVIASDGNYTLKLQANGKNASSTDYVMGIHWVGFTRTGA